MMDLLFNRVLPTFREEIIALNNFMAANPEVGGHEIEASSRIVELLRSKNIEVEYPFSGIETAFKGTINKEKKHRAALLVEYDALPEIGHACGHCASGSASVLAGLAFNSVLNDLDFGLDIIGTPDEEIHGCKCVMTQNGVFNEYDFAAMVHMGSRNAVDVKYLALDGSTIKFYGAAAHSAQAPEKGRNALNAARLFFDATDMLRQHIIQDARLHGYIVKGGSASNVVPDYAEVEFLSRAPLRKDLSDITDWIHDCARAAALATRTRCEIEPCGYPFHDLYISPIGRKIMEDCYCELGLELHPEDEKSVFGGSSDIGNVDYVCPVFHPIIGIGEELTLHTKGFAEAMNQRRAHRAIENAAKVLILLTTKLYGSPSLLADLKNSHKEYRSQQNR